MYKIKTPNINAIVYTVLNVDIMMGDEFLQVYLKTLCVHWLEFAILIFQYMKFSPVFCQIKCGFCVHFNQRLLPMCPHVPAVLTIGA